MEHEGRCPKTEKKMKGVAAAPEVKAASCCTVGSEDWDPVEVDILLEELQDIPVTPEKKGKSRKVSGRGKDPGKGENTQLKKNTSTTSYIKYLGPTRHNTDTCQTGLSKAVNLDVRPKASYNHQMRRSGSAYNTSTLPNMQKLREPTGFKSRGQGISSFQPWKKGSVQPMPLPSTKLIMEETRSLKLDKKKPLSSNLSKGITTILENTSEVRSIDIPDLPHVKKGVYKNTSVRDHKILISGLLARNVPLLNMNIFSVLPCWISTGPL
ncbi:uncharacterized protein LOC131702131 [Acipenser ruthenus]|uniref:uncharacterized protein LOC131702131 n=1 Tax=Acipenser ruthenus TaxID=7906 RepID=UPI002741B851|nr:uncharacterized protein LOC131702131 [Acipenser ruthenus]